MPLPISVSNLITGRTIESNRIEYKSGWNPQKVLHTICAFANDYENIGGGYIVIGIGEENERPGAAIGLTDAEIATLEKDLFNKCNLIQPRYVPVVSVERYQDVNARTVDGWCREGWEWGTPVSREVWLRAKAGQ